MIECLFLFMVGISIGYLIAEVMMIRPIMKKWEMTLAYWKKDLEELEKLRNEKQ